MTAFLLAALACAAVAGWGVALVWRARAVRDRLAARIAVEREVAFVEAARRLVEAASISIADVRGELDRGIHSIAPAVDSVLFFEELDAHLVCVGATGTRTTFFNGIRCALDDDASLLVRALRSGHRATLADAPVARPLHPGDAFAAAIPLALDAGRRCVVYVGGADAARGREQFDRIVRLVDGAAPAYRIAHERADDRARASYDGLTGLLTPRAFRQRFATLLETARAQPAARVALVFVDTDRFKSWNDRYGHASGDALLRELAVLLRAATTEPGDIAARNGGDEFCVVFDDTEKSRAVERAERLRCTIAEADFSRLRAPDVDGEAVRISASIGIACYPVDAQSPDTLLEKADEAMYHSKKTGRDGVSFFGTAGALVRADAGKSPRSADRRHD